MHLPVLLQEVVSFLKPRPGDCVLDATLGGGGHSIEILNRIVPGGRLIGFDKDPAAIEIARKRLGEFNDFVTLVNTDFQDVGKMLDMLNIKSLNGALFDLGLSSLQLDDASRGFSFLKDGPLDMRFTPKGELTARDIVNKFSKEKIEDILREYGEERLARFIARAIVEARRKRSFTTTKELRDLVVKTVGARYRSEKIHPACRTFQALRIYVNGELAHAKRAVEETAPYLLTGGRLCVISFHSLEDRMVKDVFRRMAEGGLIKIVTKKPVVPTRDEIKNNSRSRSAKLRVAERI